ncbi:hypothetical protein PUND_a3208 [Pseudoalteromonas undina]|jgi:hypothetical protein|uniref:Uncharacterized protein n=1 Tax=Pseudoalteromonas undina TaxID=43660 RepID=A0ABP2XX86_9GAMM|nr:hypothetical protein [Pseudoalteromonas undina]KAF7767265.1 hypothetical protein PUND_a3208 [Pseudoalteromonas undina]OLF71646.1 hypothetical protein AWH60_15755 [Pseudoalteromonas haloplanktis]
MAAWRTAIILSVCLHGLVLFFVASLKAPKIKPPQSTPIKAYMVSVPAKIKAIQQRANKNVNSEINSIEPDNATQSKSLNAINKKTDKTTEPVKISTKNTQSVILKPYKKIDLNKGLNSILQQQTGYSDTAKSDPQKKRITVPKEHAGKVKPLLKIEQQNMQFTTYRRGDSCFRKVSVGAGVMPKNDLPESYIAGVKCDKTKLTEAYDTAMNKWLKKK